VNPTTCNSKVALVVGSVDVAEVVVGIDPFTTVGSVMASISSALFIASRKLDNKNNGH
jgi:hypothetical protein